MAWHSAAAGLLAAAYAEQRSAAWLEGAKGRRRAPKLVSLPARPAPPSIGKRRREANTRLAPNIRMSSTRTSMKRRQRSSIRQDTVVRRGQPEKRWFRGRRMSGSTLETRHRCSLSWERCIAELIGWKPGNTIHARAMDGDKPAHARRVHRSAYFARMTRQSW